MIAATMEPTSRWWMEAMSIVGVRPGFEWTTLIAGSLALAALILLVDFFASRWPGGDGDG